MVMKNFLVGLSKFVLGIILAMLIMSLAGLAMARYFITRIAEQPERPTYENDLPEDQRPAAKAPGSSAANKASEDASQSAAPAASTNASAPAKEQEPAENADNAEGYKGYATTDLNVRSGPDTSYESIGGVGAEENVVVLAEEGGWLKVQLSNGTEGWVSSNYVTKE
jgi:cytoskeletal protein RodZ